MTIDTILAENHGLLLDAYGVLVKGGVALPGAVDLVRHLKEQRRPCYLVSNDASRHTDTLVRFYNDLGFPFAAEEVLSSGSLLPAWVDEHGLVGADIWVLGPRDVHRYIEDAGGRAHDPGGPPPRAIVVADNSGYDLQSGIDDTLSAIFAAIDDGRPIDLVLPNPDRIYPKAKGFGITAGSIALILEDALQRRYQNPPTFTVLGKPEMHLFNEAIARSGSRDLCMIGDQLHTDIDGAQAVGLRAALVKTGVAAWHSTTPDYIIDDLLMNKTKTPGVV